MFWKFLCWLKAITYDRTIASFKRRLPRKEQRIFVALDCFIFFWVVGVSTMLMILEEIVVIPDLVNMLFAPVMISIMFLSLFLLKGDLQKPDLRSGMRVDKGLQTILRWFFTILMMVAKNDAAQMSLSRQIKQRTITKGYIALVSGRLSPERGAIEAPVGRHPGDRKRMAVVSGGREARTAYQVIRYLDDHTLLEVMPETGRTHQIRVHLAAIGHPVFGDPIYGKRSPLLKRQFLHAHRLGFRLPSSGEYVEFTSELPQELEEALQRITREADSQPFG